MSLRTPVDVSAWTTAMTVGRRVGGERAPRDRSAGPTSPRPARPRRRTGPATSHMRSPNTPLTPTTTTSPGSTTLTNAASMPAEPVPLIGNVSGLSVRNTCRSRSHVSSSSATNSGSRWPSIGRAERLGDLGVGVAGAGTHEDAVGDGLGHRGMLPMDVDMGRSDCSPAQRAQRTVWSTVVSGSDSGAALGEQRRPALDDIAQATINERLGRPTTARHRLRSAPPRSPLRRAAPGRRVRPPAEPTAAPTLQ